MYTQEQKEAMRKCFPKVSEKELAFLEKAAEFSDSRPPSTSDIEWGRIVESFLRDQGGHIYAWEALGEALGALHHLPKEAWREVYQFGACLAVTLNCINFEKDLKRR